MPFSSQLIKARMQVCEWKLNEQQFSMRYGSSCQQKLHDDVLSLDQTGRVEKDHIQVRNLAFENIKQVRKEEEKLYEK